MINLFMLKGSSNDFRVGSVHITDTDSMVGLKEYCPARMAVIMGGHKS